MIRDAIQKLVARQDLSRREAADAVTDIADGAATPAQIAAFLTALRLKGETADEIAGAAEVMRARVDPIQVNRPVFVDTCGTGGDGQHTFNISTTAAFVVAGAGVTVAKHGNRSVSSRCGSADVLAELGVDIEADKVHVERCIDRVGIGFLFAARLHPAFKAAASVRKELGFRTLFNLLGPLVNPAAARHQVMGVFEPRWVPVVAEVLASLGAVHAFTVHGGGLDEISITGRTDLCEIKNGRVRAFTVEPEELNVRRGSIEELRGGDAALNAHMTREILSGQKGAPRDAVLVNAAAALVASGLAETLRQGVSIAAESIDSGAALRKLEALVKESSQR